MVSLLINHPRCNLNEKNEYGQTALHLGEYLNLIKNKGTTLLFSVAQEGKNNRKKIKKQKRGIFFVMLCF